MGNTSTLNLGKTFKIRMLAAQASELSMKILQNNEPTEEDKNILIILNAGLANFLTGDYAVDEPQPDGWAEFGRLIAGQFNSISEQYGSIFHHESITASILAQQPPLFIFDHLPTFIVDAIDWNKVDRHLKKVNSYFDMFIDGEVYYTGVLVPLKDSDIVIHE